MRAQPPDLAEQAQAGPGEEGDGDWAARMDRPQRVAAKTDASEPHATRPQTGGVIEGRRDLAELLETYCEWGPSSPAWGKPDELIN